MSDEHMRQLQCQTCFAHFPTNQELFGHIEEYRSRERLLVAELERCRMHIAQLDDPSGGSDSSNSDDDDDDGGGGDNNDGPRQNDLKCYEPCPFCQEIVTGVRRFMTHDCKATPDEPKDTYLQRRITTLNGAVSKKIDRLESRRDKTRKRRRGAPDSDSNRPRKMAKSTRDVLPTNVALRSDLYVDCSGGGNAETMRSLDGREIAASDQWNLPEAVAIMPSDPTNLATPVKITSGEGGDNRAPAFTELDMAVNSGAWTLAETGATASDNRGINTGMLGDPEFSETVISSKSGGWAFAETAPAMHANDSGWAFAEAVNHEGWAFAETATAHMDDGGWAFAERLL
ncbi:hypothetical protein B0T17DRAFT_614567 [Bombardia bombarda]|uniref:Uncharacterized protein n=1 Tax=Bombardia bombarda TaxID=252184 RepID=A0AA39X7D5_9PEZI|nr:hypothetical protein B0T17DRAFT_614567 [Bombardia bombarda]